MYHACDNVRIQVLMNGIKVYGPKQVQGTVQPDHCNCPEVKKFCLIIIVVMVMVMVIAIIQPTVKVGYVIELQS